VAIFEILGLLFVQASVDHDPPIYASCVAGMTGAYHHAQLSVEMASQELFAQAGLQLQSS
jgi:hypothetical protein